MIFVTVGSQMPFDRLVRAVDEWAQRHPDVEVFGQIGKTDFVPAAMKWVKVLAPDEYLRYVGGCDLLVGHAGMGTVITAAEYGKPLLVMPRRGNLRETRNDHQVATARWLTMRPGIVVAMDASELVVALDRMSERPLVGDNQRTNAEATAEGLIDAVRRFIEG